MLDLVLPVDNDELGGRAAFQLSLGLGAARSGASSSIICRSGTPNPGNLRVRPGEQALSFRSSRSEPYPQQSSGPAFRDREYFGVDTTKLPRGSVIFGNNPPGHVAVLGVSPEALRDAVIIRDKFRRK